MLHLASVLGRSSKIRSFDARFAPGAARVRRHREIYRSTPPQPAQNRTVIPSSRGREKRATRYGGGPHGHSPRLRQLNQPRATAAAQSATRYGGGPHGHVLRRRQPKQPRATAAARTATCYGGNSIIHALRRRQPTQKRGRCQSNGPAQTMRYISVRKRFLISSTLASRGLPGAQASA